MPPITLYDGAASAAATGKWSVFLYNLWGDGKIAPPRDENEREDMLFRLEVFRPYEQQSPLVRDIIAVIEALLKSKEAHSLEVSYRPCVRQPGTIERHGAGDVVEYGQFDEDGRFIGIGLG